jgi:hypothetical protein
MRFGLSLRVRVNGLRFECGGIWHVGIQLGVYLVEQIRVGAFASGGE